MQSNEYRPYFVPGFGISRHIIFSHINFFLGPYASVRPYSYHGREGYLVTAPGPQLTKVFLPPRLNFASVECSRCSCASADGDHRTRLRICKISQNNTSWQQPRGCGVRTDLAPKTTISTDQFTCINGHGTRTTIEAGEVRGFAPHAVHGPCLLLMLLLKPQSSG